MSVYNVDLVKLFKKVLRKKLENVLILLISEDIEFVKIMIYYIDDS